MLAWGMEKHRHFEPQNFADRLALFLVKSFVKPRDWLFKDQHTHHFLVLETVAAIPGMVAGALIHFSCLRRIADDKGWIETLIKEAETERKHLLVLRQMVEPSLRDRVLIWIGHFIFLIMYFLVYVFCPRAAHRFVGYLEEDAVRGYEGYLSHLDEHPEENGLAPSLAYEFWGDVLPKKARVRDLIEVILQEEAHHRDVNHGFADQLMQKKKDRGGH